MDKVQETGVVVNQDNVLKDDDIEKTNTEKCRCIFVHRHLTEFLEKKWLNIIYERIKYNPREWSILKLNEIIALVKSDMLKSVVIECSDLFVTANYQDMSSSTTSSAVAGATAPDPCDCFNSFSILKNILNSEENNNWAFFWKCHGKTYLYFGDEQTTISIEDFNTLEVIVDEIRKLDHQAKDVFNTRIPLGETENGMGNVITLHVVSQEDFFKEANEIVYQKRQKIKQLNSFIILHCGIFEVVDEVQNSKDSSSNVESPGASAKSTVNNDDLRALLAGSLIPLRTLLQCIVVRLTPTNWQELRRCVSRDIPLRVLENIPNNIEFFQELENRELIQIGNTEYLSSGLYEIERVDLVHLLDCIQDGDYSLLTSDTARDRRIGDENRSSLPTGLTRNFATEARRSVNTADQLGLWSPGANTQTPVTQIRDSVVSGGSTATSDDVTENEGTTPRRLERRYRNAPTRTTPSPFPVQEETEERSQGTRASSGSEPRAQEQNSANILSDPNPDNNGSNANGATIQSANAEQTSAQGSNAEAILPQGAVSRDTLPQGANADGRRSQGTSEDGTHLQATNTEATVSRGVDSEDSSRWTGSETFSCAHYDRYCLVKFPCCEPFWPCHRCHNSKSKCGEKKLKSRNIKKLKCRKCGKVQDFPKESPHCVQCNLKFAEYFCPICQHLTGVQNHPFHCVKCGICRVHQDRSFHCDVCGVCLDVNLRNNHKCRAGSAHDKCVKCKEDAFTGCQILPCSHKVHKECANQMIKSGVTRCPICNESFEHKVGKPKKPK